MHRKLFLISIGVILLAGGILGWQTVSRQSYPDPSAHENFLRQQEGPPARIISLAPSITEVLFALGLGGRVVGVTRYCDYPPEARSLPRVGGYLDVNYEAALDMEPDLVVLLEQHEEARRHFARFGIRVMAVDHSTVDGIIGSILAIGETSGVGAAAGELVRNFRARIQRVVDATRGQDPPTVMVAVGRSLKVGSMGEVYISGRDGIYDDLIRLAGGVNAYGDDTLKFPALSAEGVARLNPQVIIEMVPDIQGSSGVDVMMEQWRSIPGLDAASKGRVHILRGDHVVIPGPRFVLILEEMARLIHPELPWDEVL